MEELRKIVHNTQSASHTRIVSDGSHALWPSRKKSTYRKSAQLLGSRARTGGGTKATNKGLK